MQSYPQNSASYLASPRRPKSSIGLIIVALFAALLTGAFAGLAGGITALVVAIFLIFSFAAILDFRFGAILAVFILPLSGTQVMPRELFGVVGANPLNLLIATAVFSLILTRPFMREKVILPELPKRAWLMIGLILVGGLFGALHVSQIPYNYRILKVVPFETPVGYIAFVVLRPLFYLAIGYMLAVLVVNAKVPHRLLTLIFLSSMIMPIFVVILVSKSGLSLSSLATAHARGFLSRLGIHANELGLMFNMALALVIFTWVQIRNFFVKILLASVGLLLLVAVFLTFSRGAMLGFGAVVMYFLFTAKKFHLMLGTVLVVIAASLLMPAAVVQRASAGIATGNVGEISAGRVDSIWLPLLPEVVRSPLIGHGMSSVLWSDAARARTINAVGHTHSAYLGVLLDFGLLGAGLIFLFYQHMWRYFRALSENYPEAIWRGYFKGGQACILLLIVQGATDDRFTPTFPQIFMWLTYGLAIGLTARLARQNASAGLVAK